MKHYLAILFFIACSVAAGAQQDNTASTAEKPKSLLIQFSGMLLTEEGGRLRPVPYATVYLPNKNRGTYSDYRGFFTLVVEKGDKVRFTCIGLESVTITVPDTLTQDQYSVVQLMTQDTINLPETVIFPWPSKEHFKIEFLKMDVTPELQRRAAENLANEYLSEARKNPDIVPYGGRESANFYLRQQAREYVYIGQTPPMNIFSPLAWGQFFKAWKDGKFKKQKKEDD
ncbi:MAG: carboxypeptidase-like regulatory domain-containing protein [Saprospiraceae bacterium]